MCPTRRAVHLGGILPTHIIHSTRLDVKSSSLIGAIELRKLPIDDCNRSIAPLQHVVREKIAVNHANRVHRAQNVAQLPHGVGLRQRLIDKSDIARTLSRVFAAELR
eukprot:TRINITY_DN7748_c0_g1_i1.p2 TRINITY_DN7748_c0_g1~~TRINITY_DN7748_c0_g1_i1.p2  ORF type:complete len:107 (+),score=9.85 TRINITY_DN7748_c0_g1_i1:123-443(+)